MCRQIDTKPIFTKVVNTEVKKSKPSSSDVVKAPRLEKPVRITEQVWPEGTVPVVSVFCITFNHEKFIRDAIEGFLMQETTFPVEIFVHDDASTDATADIVREYAEKHPQLFWTVLQIENQFSKGKRRIFFEYLAQQRGELIALCEGDDYWSNKNKLLRQTSLLDRNPRLALCHHRVTVMSNQETLYEKPAQRYRTQTIRGVSLAQENFIQTCSVMVRKQYCPKPSANLQVNALGDWPLFAWAVQYGDIGYIDTPMAVYRLHETNMWVHKPQHERQNITNDMKRQLVKALKKKHAWAYAATLPEFHYSEAKRLASEGHAYKTAVAVGGMFKYTIQHKPALVLPCLIACSRMVQEYCRWHTRRIKLKTRAFAGDCKMVIRKIRKELAFIVKVVVDNVCVQHIIRYKQKRVLNSSRCTDALSEKPLVSVIMATHNRVHRIKDSINSVIDQSYERWELIIIDDGSTDGTADTITSEFDDARIRVIQSQHQGVSSARNKGLKSANGEFIAYLDSDNTYEKDYLRGMIAHLLNAKADHAYAVLKCKRERSVYYRYKRYKHDHLYIHNFIDLNVYMHTKTLTELFGGFDESLKRYVDWDLILRHSAHSKPDLVNVIGATYDASSRTPRITNNVSDKYLNVVRNKHLISWEDLERNQEKRRGDLVSIITCTYNRSDLLNTFLSSLLGTESGMPFELIVVNNGNDWQTERLLRHWLTRDNRLGVVWNPDNYNFALGNNLGFQASKGSRVVFINNDTRVAPDWLAPLMTALGDTAIKGAQPLLVYPDGSIQCCGLVFSSKSPLAYPIYVGCDARMFPAQQARNYSAVTAACVVMRASDFIQAKGFDPVFINGQEDVDLCLKVGKGEHSFRYVPDSVVVHMESKSPGRNARILDNRLTFIERWQNKIRPDDFEFYSNDKIEVREYSPDRVEWTAQKAAVYRPNLSALNRNTNHLNHEKLQNWRVAIKIACPNRQVRNAWGDYHYASALSKAFARIGIRSNVEFLENWTRPEPNTVSLVLRGLAPLKFKIPCRSHLSLMWVISHPENVTEKELRSHDHVFVASEAMGNIYEKSLGKSLSVLMQCTDRTRFYPRSPDIAPQYNLLLVGNSRNIFRTSVKAAIEANVPVDIIGGGWNQFVPEKWIKGTEISNDLLPETYARCNVIINDHWDSMNEQKILSNRVFDAIAMGKPIVTDTVEGLPTEIACAAFKFNNSETFRSAVRDAKDAAAKTPELFHRASKLIRDLHSFDNRAEKIAMKMLSFIS